MISNHNRKEDLGSVKFVYCHHGVSRRQHKDMDSKTASKPTPAMQHNPTELELIYTFYMDGKEIRPCHKDIKDIIETPKTDFLC